MRGRGGAAVRGGGGGALRGGIARLLLILVGAVAVPMTQVGPASAFCLSDNGQRHIQAYSPAAGSVARGIKSSLLSPTADAGCGIVRSIAVIRSNGDFAEVGLFEPWGADFPHPFVAWDGDAGYRDWHAGYTVSESVLYGFRIEDANGNYNWTGYFTGSVLHTTGTLPFNKGIPITNTESDDPPNDTAYGRYTALGWCSQLKCQSWANFNPACYRDTDTTGHLDLVSSTELYTRNGQTADGCAGTT